MHCVHNSCIKYFYSFNHRQPKSKLSTAILGSSAKVVQETGLTGSGRAPKAAAPGAGRLKTEVSDSGQRRRGLGVRDDGVHWVRQGRRRLPQRRAALALGGCEGGGVATPRAESHVGRSHASHLLERSGFKRKGKDHTLLEMGLSPTGPARTLPPARVGRGWQF